MLRHARLVVAATAVLSGTAVFLLAPRVPLGVAAARAAKSYTARGVVQSIAKDGSSITIAHEAIAGVMPAMTMSFETRAEQVAGIHEKDKVTFAFTVTDDGRRVIDSIRAAG